MRLVFTAHDAITSTSTASRIRTSPRIRADSTGRAAVSRSFIQPPLHPAHTALTVMALNGSGTSRCGRSCEEGVCAGTTSRRSWPRQCNCSGRTLVSHRGMTCSRVSGRPPQNTHRRAAGDFPCIPYCRSLLTDTLLYRPRKAGAASTRRRTRRGPGGAYFKTSCPTASSSSALQRSRRKGPQAGTDPQASRSSSCSKPRSSVISGAVLLALAEDTGGDVVLVAESE
jgi:hypothetical protein